MRQNRKTWLKIVQATYPNVLKPIARQIEIEKIVSRRNKFGSGVVAPAPVKP